MPLSTGKRPSGTSFCTKCGLSVAGMKTRIFSLLAAAVLVAGLAQRGTAQTPTGGAWLLLQPPITTDKQLLDVDAFGSIANWTLQASLSTQQDCIDQANALTADPATAMADIPPDLARYLARSLLCVNANDLPEMEKAHMAESGTIVDDPIWRKVPRTHPSGQP